MLYSRTFAKNTGTEAIEAQSITKTPKAKMIPSKGKTSKLVTKNNPGN